MKSGGFTAIDNGKAWCWLGIIDIFLYICELFEQVLLELNDSTGTKFRQFAYGTDLLVK
ncbi:hypothetical protein Back11_39410 [Paenibacillus baekrokdamisoli]|uniref:Uncharacterized protein n=1 Tax=Paenibacillus baekrokdamisoli TaxID=1712516 RepID=A0A3G9IVT1_9BACL|nr:hypothetical protein [Paenibacillus baekrokdamisoli]BBH22596.1 hypothetical protein Back11_39410 [Paenibacillus baekrokdamisoli]